MENRKIFRSLNILFVILAIFLWFYLAKVGKNRELAFLPLIPVFASFIFLRKYKD
ncbi:hypothetical protein HV819_09380 [Anaerococcus sp. AGMB00486]|uniref:Exosortase n=1 Tax=Anaerococcus faecalis TaxID=2742993 RepID=A0ABX2NBX5_9FIRM|nr:hypothetical protein [Anaerococcus faecalis]NVF12165.1 hypothetical protein [Anaerococcus faecalis]